MHLPFEQHVAYPPQIASLRTQLIHLEFANILLCGAVMGLIHDRDGRRAEAEAKLHRVCIDESSEVVRDAVRLISGGKRGGGG